MASKVLTKLGKLFYFNKIPEDPSTCSQAYLNLGPDAHFTLRWLIPSNTRTEMLGSPMTNQIESCEFKMPGNRRRKWLIPENYFNSTRIYTLYMVGLHATTEMSMYLSQWNSKHNVYVILP